ncbi:MAG: thiol:disulfide interchange protein DsbA/DsbL [Colwelliaceae bacterium]|jgi:thiol:disulfide interchange protein DsbA|nr:thiol:disulfide interchange protein DsbA/DsbL [Colwelliaceae bacterium]
MNKLLSIFVIALLPFVSNAKDYEEGEHYVKVHELAVKSPEVREYFSFYCGHCFKFEVLAKSITKNLPEGTEFVKNHVDFLPGASRKMQSLLSRALITAQEMEMAESQIAAIFKYIHVHRAVFTSVRDVRNVFLINGADGEKFDQLINSDKVIKQVEKMKSNQDILAKSGDLKSVPTVIVNGKYMVLGHGHSHGKGSSEENLEQDYNDLVKYLLTLD